MEVKAGENRNLKDSGKLKPLYNIIKKDWLNMNTKFFVNGHCYKTPCKTVLNADTFTVKFFTDEHIITANISDKCYFVLIDNIALSDIKCDFHFSRNYTNPKEFLTNLYDSLISFLNTYVKFTEGHFPHSTDDVIRRILEIIQMKDDTYEITNPEDGEFVYDVGIHNFYECRTYTVRADNPESAGYKALKRMKNGNDDKEYYSIDFIRIHKENSEEKSELNTKYDVLADDQFHQLTKTLIKSLFKAIGTNETRKIPFIISNNMVFFNYNGIQYKYYPSQCKVFKKCDRKYQRINWKDFADDNSLIDQKQAFGRSPPLLLI